MSAPAEKPPDESRIVALLAEQSRRPVAQVAEMYEQERAALALEAHITKFLHIFAIRNVQARLRQHAVPKFVMPTGIVPG